MVSMKRTSIKAFKRSQTGASSRSRIHVPARIVRPEEERDEGDRGREMDYEQQDGGYDFGGDDMWVDYTEGGDGNSGARQDDGRGVERPGQTAEENVDATPAQMPKNAQTRQDEERAFDSWSNKFDDLVAPFLSATRGRLPSSDAWTDLTCACVLQQREGLRAPTHQAQIFVLDFESIRPVPFNSCETHARATLIRAGIFPATPSRPTTGFTFALLRFFRALQGQTRLGTAHFVKALLHLYQEGTTKMDPKPAIVSKDRYRKQFKAAFGWYKALELRSEQKVLGDDMQASAAFVRQELRSDQLSLRVEGLAARCPACFGGLLPSKHSRRMALSMSEPSQNHPADDTATGQDGPAKRQEPQVIVCLDGNFQHKRWRKEDGVIRSQIPPSYFASEVQLTKAKQEFDESAGAGPATGCGSYVKAALDGVGSQKGSLGPFDITGVVGMTCRHGTPLILVDVIDAAEGHHYAYALTQLLLEACGSRLTSLGICYDIGCKLAVSPRMQASLATRFKAVELRYAVSVFHVYGHDTDCQLKYSPRRCPGFGWTDGESLERLWSSLRDLVSITRPMSLVSRRQALTVRLERITVDARTDLMETLRTRFQNTAKAMKKEIDAMKKLEAAVRAALVRSDMVDVLKRARSAVGGDKEATVGGEAGDGEEDGGTGETAQDGDNSAHAEHASSPDANLAAIDDVLLTVGGLMPASLAELLDTLTQLIRSRRELAFNRRSVNRKAQKRLAQLTRNALRESNMVGQGDAVEAEEQERASTADVERARQAKQRASRGPANMLQYLVTRDKTAREALAAAALALHTPLVQWHSITDQIASRKALPSNKIIIRQTTSKSGCSAKARQELALFNSMVEQHNTIVAECRTLQEGMLARRPKPQEPLDQSFVALAAVNHLSEGELHYSSASGGQTGTRLDARRLAGESHRRAFEELEAYRPSMPTVRIESSSLLDRGVLDQLAALIDPSDRSFQPWVLDPALASSMDHLERMEMDRLGQEVGDSVGWLDEHVEGLRALRTVEKDEDRLALIRRKEQTYEGLGWFWKSELERIDTARKDYPYKSPGEPVSAARVDLLRVLEDAENQDSQTKHDPGARLLSATRGTGTRCDDVNEDDAVPSDHGSSADGASEPELESDDEGVDLGGRQVLAGFGGRPRAGSRTDVERGAERSAGAETLGADQRTGAVYRRGELEGGGSLFTRVGNALEVRRGGSAVLEGEGGEANDRAGAGTDTMMGGSTADEEAETAQRQADTARRQAEIARRQAERVRRQEAVLGSVNSYSFYGGAGPRYLY